MTEQSTLDKRRGVAIAAVLAAAALAVVLTVILPVGAARSSAADDGIQAAITHQWGAIVAGDEFDGDAVDGDKWIRYGDYAGHAGNGMRLQAKDTVANGYLTISGDADGNTGGIAWRQGQKYGRWEIRMRVMTDGADVPSSSVSSSTTASGSVSSGSVSSGNTASSTTASSTTASGSTSSGATASGTGSVPPSSAAAPPVTASAAAPAATTSAPPATTTTSPATTSASSTTSVSSGTTHTSSSSANPPRGNAYHPVLLLWPDADDWPDGGELDYAETDAGATTVKAFMHYGDGTLEGAQDGYTVGHFIDLTQWHNYAIEWAPDHISGYVDGLEWFRNTNPEAQPPGTMHETIQLDDFFPQGGLAPAHMDVDWVRMYDLATGSVTPTPTPTPPPPPQVSRFP